MLSQILKLSLSCPRAPARFTCRGEWRVRGHRIAGKRRRVSIRAPGVSDPPDNYASMYLPGGREGPFYNGKAYLYATPGSKEPDVGSILSGGSYLEYPVISGMMKVYNNDERHVGPANDLGSQPPAIIYLVQRNLYAAAYQTTYYENKT